MPRSFQRSPGPKRGWGRSVRVVALLLLSALAGCWASAPPPQPLAGTVEAAPPYRLIQIVEGNSDSATTDTLGWREPTRPEAEAWARAVGPALVYRPSVSGHPVDLTDLAIVSWNVHVGGGDIETLIRELRKGGVDGRPAPAFVLLLQEVFRAGAEVPEDPGPEARKGRRIAHGPEDRQDRSIQAIARRNGLHLLYVPSMGNGSWGEVAEDRGNAILSTLPLRDPEALELPLEGQRRVAVSARVRVGDGAGSEVDLRLVSLHLDVRSRWRRLYRSLGAARAEQARTVVEGYGGEPAAVLGGDLNTWLGGPREAAVRILSEAFPLPDPREDRHTLHAPGPLPDLMLDHLFFRLPAGMDATIEVASDRYGSDHYPVVGRILGPNPIAQSREAR